MAEMYLGQLLPFAGNYVISGTAAANGDLVPIQQNSALFAVVGINYGGDGRNTFGLPDLRCRVPVGFGTSPSVGSTINIGASAGVSNVTLTAAQMPIHNHPAATSGLAVNTSGLSVNTSGLGVNTSGLTATLKAAGSSGDSQDPAGSPLGQFPNGFVDGGTATVPMAASSIQLGGSASITGTASLSGTAGVSGTVTVGAAGGSLPVPILNPYVAINWLVVMQGLFPTRP